MDVFTLTVKKEQNTQLKELSGLQMASLLVKKGLLVEHKGNTNDAGTKGSGQLMHLPTGNYPLSTGQ